MGPKITAYCPRGKFVSVETLPFKELLPLKLKTYVSGKNDRSAARAPCVQEMSVLFACLKKHEFQESSCPKELESFHKCNANFKAQQKRIALSKEKGEIIPKEKNLNHQQLTALLKRFP